MVLYYFSSILDSLSSGDRGCDSMGDGLARKNPSKTRGPKGEIVRVLERFKWNIEEVQGRQSFHSSCAEQGSRDINPETVLKRGIWLESNELCRCNWLHYGLEQEKITNLLVIARILECRNIHS